MMSERKFAKTKAAFLSAAALSAGAYLFTRESPEAKANKVMRQHAVSIGSMINRLAAKKDSPVVVEQNKDGTRSLLLASSDGRSTYSVYVTMDGADPQKTTDVLVEKDVDGDGESELTIAVMSDDTDENRWFSVYKEFSVNNHDKPKLDVLTETYSGESLLKQAGNISELAELIARETIELEPLNQSDEPREDGIIV